MYTPTPGRTTLLLSLALLAVPRPAAQAGPVAGSGSKPVKPNMQVKDVITPAAAPFALKDVRLLEGPFRHAMQKDEEYLLSLEPDRLLSRFREYAGLKPKAPIYGGWEAQGVSGHTLGHYLSACSMAYAATGDARFKQRVDYIVDELALCQSKHPDGYVGAIPDGERIWKEVAAGDIRSQGFDLNGGWVPWYTMHKVFAGLLDANTQTGSAKALAVATRLGDWAISETKNLNDEQWQKMLACEHGGMNEALANLYALTGQKRFLDLSEKFYHKAVLDPLSRREERLAGLHANTQIPKVIGAARLYELTGEDRFKTIASFFWDAVLNDHTYVIGGNSDGEHFGPPKKLSDRLSANTTETCNTYNMLKLTRHLFEWQPSVRAADYYERALYNHILASQDPETGMMCYYVSLQPGGHKVYSTPFDSFWCCVGTGIENHVKYGEGIYYHGPDSLYVNLFIPSILTWRDKNLTVRQETRFPEEGRTRLTISAKSPVTMALQVRCPSWAAGDVAVRVNGKTAATGKPGTFAAVRRTWKDGDTVEVTIPMALRTEPMPDNAEKVALLYGPIVLAGNLGPEDKEVARVPVFVTGGEPLTKHVEPVAGQALAFRTEEVGRPEDVTFAPFYRTSHARYSVYWEEFTESQWKDREAAYRAEEARRKELEARTLDYLAVGEMQPERDHAVTGDKTGAGEAMGRKWRHATDGGWFSFEMKVSPDAPADLVLTYWGSDANGRDFDILVDGTKIASQVLENNRPGQFYDETYPIPRELTSGKEKVTVRLQAHPGRWAGGLFGARTVRRTSPEATSP